MTIVEEYGVNDWLDKELVESHFNCQDKKETESGTTVDIVNIFARDLPVEWLQIIGL